MKALSSKKALIYFEIFTDLVLSAIKMIFGVVSGSSSMVSEGLHSLSDAGNQVFLAIGLSYSKKKSDHIHPFGYGKERSFWALMAAIFIAGVSGVISIQEGIEKIIHQEPLSNFYSNAIILCIAIVLSFVNLYFSSRKIIPLFHVSPQIKTWRERFHNIKTPIVINLWIGDIASILGNIIALIAISVVYVSQNPIYDGYASLIIGILLVLSGLFLAYDAKGLLIGEAVSMENYKKILNTVHSFKEVNKVLDLKTMHLASNEILVTLDVHFKNNLTTEEIAKTVDTIESKIRKILPHSKYIYIEVENS